MAFRSVAHTCNPVHVYTFSWTIENITRIPEELTGPSFSPIPKRSETFNFVLNVKKFNYNFVAEYLLEVYLNIQKEQTFPKSISVDKDKEDQTYNFFCDVTLINVDDRILKSAKAQLMKVYKNTSSTNRVLFTFLRQNPEKCEFLDLPEDKLILKATLSLSGYDLVSNIFSSTITHSEVSKGELSKDLKAMFESGVAHDVTFSVGEKTIPVHSAILSSRSPVLAKMFQHDMLEKSSKNVVIEDVDFPVFNCFLLFLYTGQVEEKNWEAVVPLYSLGDKYEMESLRKECSRILSDSLSIGSVCRVLELADLHGDTELKETAKIFFRGNFTRVIETSEWAKIVVTKPELASEVLGSFKSISQSELCSTAVEEDSQCRIKNLWEEKSRSYTEYAGPEENVRQPRAR